jgi:protein O-mannosyl-transferase
MIDRSKGRANLQFAYLAIIVICVTLLAMGRISFHGFTIWDDNFTVSRNPRLNPPSWEAMKFYCLHSEQRIYIPLTRAVWAALALIARTPADRDGITLDPLIFHTANLLLHLLAVLVVCRILFMIGASWIAALLGSLLFAIHPIQVEAVAWVSGLKDVLSGLLVLIAIWQYLEFATGDQRNARRVAPLLRCIAVLILAMLAKASAATMPLAAIALDRWIVHRQWKKIVVSAGLVALTTIPFVFIAKVTQSGNDFVPIPLWQRPLIVGDSLAFYAYKLVWPVDLCIDYGRRPWLIVTQPWIYFAWIVPGTVACILIILRKRAQWMISAGLVFIAGCSSTLGLTSFGMQYFSTVADHYIYWAMLGPAVALAWILTKFSGAASLRSGVIIAIAILALLTIRQCGFWTNDRSLFERTISMNPKSFMAYNNLGNHYFRESNLPLAVDMYRRAIGAKFNYSVPHSNLAIALHQMGDLEGSTKEFEQSIALQRPLFHRLRQTWVFDYNNLATNLLEAGKPSEAAAAFRESLAAQPDQPDVIASLNRTKEMLQQPATTASSAPAAR